MLGGGRELGERQAHARARRACVHAARAPELLQDRVLLEGSPAVVERLAHPVGVEVQEVALIQHALEALEPLVVEEAERQAARLPQPLQGAPVAQDGRVVAGVHVGEPARLEVELAAEEGDEHVGVVSQAQLVVRGRHGDLEGHAGHDVVLDLRLGPHHEKRPRDPLAGHVGDQEDEAALADAEEVVEVAPHLLGGSHRGEDVEAVDVGEGRELARQRGLLDDLGRGEVLDVALGHLVDGVPERRHRGVDPVRERVELRDRALVHALVELAGADAGERLVRAADGLHDDAAKQRVHHAKDRREDEQEKNDGVPKRRQTDLEDRGQGRLQNERVVVAPERAPAQELLCADIEAHGQAVRDFFEQVLVKIPT